MEIGEINKHGLFSIRLGRDRSEALPTVSVFHQPALQLSKPTLFFAYGLEEPCYNPPFGSFLHKP